MTREEEIRQKIDLQLAGCFGNYSEGYEEGFIEGAKWADETMIEKACEWLENNVNNYIIIDDYLGKVQPKISSSMFDDFKKAMEL